MGGGSGGIFLDEEVMARIAAPLPTGGKAVLDSESDKDVALYIELWKLEYERQNADAQRWTMLLGIAAATGLLAMFKKW